MLDVYVKTWILAKISDFLIVKYWYWFNISHCFFQVSDLIYYYHCYYVEGTVHHCVSLAPSLWRYNTKLQKYPLCPLVSFALHVKDHMEYVMVPMWLYSLHPDILKIHFKDLGFVIIPKILSPRMMFYNLCVPVSPPKTKVTLEDFGSYCVL